MDRSYRIDLWILMYSINTDPELQYRPVDPYLYHRYFTRGGVGADDSYKYANLPSPVDPDLQYATLPSPART